MTWETNHPLVSGKTITSPMVQALLGNPQSHPPVWFMRQAGRSLPEYRKLREGISMLESCLIPELAAEITLQPVRRHKVDAAVFFSDIVIPLKLAEINVEIVPGVGPVIANPISSRQEFEKIKSRTIADSTQIESAIKIATEELQTIPLLGFGGAPFTLASYLIEGGPSKDIPVSRRIMKEDEKLWADILTWCAELTAQFLRIQIKSGASAVQLFDSWAGRLSVAEYEKYAMPYSKIVFDSILDLDVPRIHFGVGTRNILKQMHGIGATVMSVSNDISIEEAVSVLGKDIPIQGNLNPELLLGHWSEIEREAKLIIESGRKAKSHIFNLGHGVLPETDPEILTRLVEFVHSS